MTAARWLARQWFLVALAALLWIGSVFHAELATPASAVPRDLLVTAIMFLMSAPLDLRRSLSGRGAWAAVAIAVVLNAGLAGPAAWLLGGSLPTPLAVGLIIAGLSPCTLASAAIWTRRGGGNEAASLVVTVITNLGCFLTLPAWAWLLLNSTQEVDAAGLAVRLLSIVVAPIVAGQLVRTVGPVRRWCGRHRRMLGTAAQLGLLCMVFVGSVRCGALLSRPETALDASAWAGLVVAAGVLHCGLFATGWLAARLLGCDRYDALPAAVAGSQKTLAIGLDIAMGFGGLVILPMVVYHALQLLIDAVLVVRLGPVSERTPAPGSLLTEPLLTDPLSTDPLSTDRSEQDTV